MAKTRRLSSLSVEALVKLRDDIGITLSNRAADLKRQLASLTGTDIGEGRKRGRPRKSSKRGRPRKSSKRGRPRKSSKRGRPRKSGQRGRPRKPSMRGRPRKASNVASRKSSLKGEGSRQSTAAGKPPSDRARPAPLPPPAA